MANKNSCFRHKEVLKKFFNEYFRIIFTSAIPRCYTFLRTSSFFAFNWVILYTIRYMSKITFFIIFLFISIESWEFVPLKLCRKNLTLLFLFKPMTMRKRVKAASLRYTVRASPRLSQFDTRGKSSLRVLYHIDCSIKILFEMSKCVYCIFYLEIENE